MKQRTLVRICNFNLKSMISEYHDISETVHSHNLLLLPLLHRKLFGLRCCDDDFNIVMELCCVHRHKRVPAPALHMLLTFITILGFRVPCRCILPHTTFFAKEISLSLRLCFVTTCTCSDVSVNVSVYFVFLSEA